MKNVIVSIVLFVFSLNIAFADSNCNWDTIKLMPNGDFEYTPALNLCVGQLVQTNKTQAAQIADYEKAISLKDLALTNADARTQLWMTSATNEQDRLNKLNSDQRHDDWLYFGLGIATTFAAAYAAGQLIHR